MKVLIWILNFIVISILNLICAYITGFKLGTILFYIIYFFISRAMCRAWDEHRIKLKSVKPQVAEQKGKILATLDSVKEDIPTFVMSHCEENRGNYSLLKSDLRYYVKCGYITREQANILLEEYLRARECSEENHKKSEAQANQISFCRICGEKLISGSKFCRKCGTEIVEISD